MPGTVFRFKRFIVDTSAHVLVKDGVRVSIQEQPFQVLLALLASPGKVVTREALRTRLWGTDTFVDFDQSLNSAVRRLRLALDDNSREPTYIETIPRLGFRLLPEVTQEAAASVLSVAREESPVLAEPEELVPPLPPQAVPESGGVPRSRPSRLAGAGLLTLCLGFLLGIAPARWTTSRVAMAAPPLRWTPLIARVDPEEPVHTANPDMTLPVAAPGPRESGTPASLSPGASMQELQGWYHLRQRTDDDFLAARQDFEQVVQSRPGTASALVGMAQADILLALDGNAPRQRVQQARSAGQRALTLAPHLASAHAVIGAADALADWNDAEAGQEFQTALHLDSHDSLSHLWYAVFVLLPRRQFPAAEREANLAIQEDPLSLIAHTDLGWILYSDGKRRAALDQYRFVLQLNPGFVPAQFRLRQAAAESNDAGLQQWIETQQARVTTAGLRQGANITKDPSKACTGASVPHATLEAVQTAVEEHCPEAYFFGQNPELAKLRNDPKFVALLNTAHPIANPR